MLKLIDSSPQVDDPTLARFNAYFGNKLPPAMLAFYRSANGGYLRGEDEDTDPTGVASLIAVGDGRTCIENLHRDYIQGFPHLAEYVPFAEDNFGNCYVLSLRDEDYGHIYLHLLEDDELMLIEDSFEELMEGIEQRQHKAHESRAGASG